MPLYKKNKNNKLPQTAPSKNIAQAGRQLPTVNRQKFITFLDQNSKVARFFVCVICEFSSALDMDTIAQHSNSLDWQGLSRNRS